jgi:hypothetical protein
VGCEERLLADFNSMCFDHVLGEFRKEVEWEERKSKKVSRRGHAADSPPTVNWTVYAGN